jgi:undecaprenyl-diphosphatase
MMIRNLLALDARWSARLRVAERPGTLRTLAVILAHSGDSWFWGAGLALLWLLGPTDWRPRAVTLVLSIAILAGMVFAIKLLVRRQRPAGEWGEIYRSTDPHSFPSGHAARAVMLAIVLWALGPAWLAWIVLLWAPLVALARVAMGVHYLSDIAAGLILGALVGWGIGLFLAAR